MGRGRCFDSARLACSNVKFQNVFRVGFAFMFIFAAFNTSTYIAKNVINSVTLQTNGTYKGDAYLSSSIIYICFAVSDWVAPIVISLIGIKFSLLIGAIPYCLYVASFIYPMEWTLYLSSVLVGIGASILWTSQGVLITSSSDDKQMTRNSAIFWLLFHFGMLIGNIIEFFLLKDKAEFEPEIRIMLFFIFTCICVVGVLTFWFINMNGYDLEPNLEHKYVPVAQSEESEGKTAAAVRLTSMNGWNDIPDDEEAEDDILFSKERSSGSHRDNKFGLQESKLEKIRKTGSMAWETLKRSFRLLFTKNMLGLTLTFIYSGLHNTFRGGIFPSCVGQNLNFDDSKAFIGGVQFALGVSQVVAPSLVIAFGSRVSMVNRYPLVITSFIFHTIAYVLVFLDFPDDCSLHETIGSSIISSKAVAIVAAISIGIGDSLLSTVTISMLGMLYSGTALLAPAFAVSGFLSALFSSVAFFYASATLKYHLTVLIVLNCASLVGFMWIECSHKKASVITKAEG